MITEAIMDQLLKIISYLIDGIMNQMQLPVGQHIDIPSPIFPLFQDTFNQVFLIYPLMFGWWVWRQIKA